MGNGPGTGAGGAMTDAMALIEVAGVVVAIVVGLLGIAQWQLAPLRRNVDTVNRKVDLLIVAVAEVLPHIAARAGPGSAASLEGFRRALLRLLAPTLRFEERAENPLNREERQRLASYQVTLEVRLLTPREAADFLVIVDKIRADHPQRPESGALSAGAFILVGLAAWAAAIAREE